MFGYDMVRFIERLPANAEDLTKPVGAAGSVGSKGRKMATMPRKPCRSRPVV
ncbi:MAG: hypothetical protein OXG36_00585 [Caldilineaceae bacterium]|nr:hypothetical protein [Caldilineaceae bacterium]